MFRVHVQHPAPGGPKKTVGAGQDKQMKTTGSRIINADSRQIPLPDCSVHCCVTSPPYYKRRNYGCNEQLGRENSVPEFNDQLVKVMREVRRVIRDDGTVWLNIGTTYDGGQDLQIPQRLSIALADDGWHVKSDIIWHKTNTAPSSGRSSPSQYHEHVFLLTKTANHYYDHLAVMENGKRGLPKRITSVWSIAVAGKGQDNHPAIMPEALPEVCILLGSSDGGCCPVCGAPYRRDVETGHAFLRRNKDKEIKQPISDTLMWLPTCECKAGAPVPCVVLDPFAGSGTVPCVAHRLGRIGIGVELNPDYSKNAEARLSRVIPVTEPPKPPKGFCYATDTCVTKHGTPKHQFRYANVELWAKVFPMFKKVKLNPEGGRPRQCDRKTLNGILIHMIDGVPWRQLPADVGVGMTALRTYRKWEKDGTWERILPILKAMIPGFDNADIKMAA